MSIAGYCCCSYVFFVGFFFPNINYWSPHLYYQIHINNSWESWTRWSPEIPSNSCNSLILWNIPLSKDWSTNICVECFLRLSEFCCWQYCNTYECSFCCPLNLDVYIKCIGVCKCGSGKTMKDLCEYGNAQLVLMYQQCQAWSQRFEETKAQTWEKN